MRMLSPRPELRPSAAELLALPLLSQHKHEEVRSPKTPVRVSRV